MWAFYINSSLNFTTCSFISAMGKIHFLAFHRLFREDQHFDMKTWREIYNLCRSWNKFKENGKKNEEIVTLEEPKCEEALSSEDNSEDTNERSSLG